MDGLPADRRRRARRRPSTSVNPRSTRGGPHPNPDAAGRPGATGRRWAARRSARRRQRRGGRCSISPRHSSACRREPDGHNGVVSGGGKSATYGSVARRQALQHDDQWGATTTAPLKPTSQYKVVGTPVPRFDIPDKVTGKYTYVQNVASPGCCTAASCGHAGRRPARRDRERAPGGTQLLSVDESSIRNIAGARSCAAADFVGVVAPTEYAAVQAAAQLKVKWPEADALPGGGNLYSAMRAKTTATRGPQQRQRRKRRSSRRPRWYRHVRVAVPDPRPDRPEAARSPTYARRVRRSSRATQGGYGQRRSVAEVLGVPRRTIRVDLTRARAPTARAGEDKTSRSRRRSCRSCRQAGARPVHALGQARLGEPRPGRLADIRGGLDANGKMIAYDYTSIPAGGTPADDEHPRSVTLPNLGEPARVGGAQTPPRRTSGHRTPLSRRPGIIAARVGLGTDDGRARLRGEHGSARSSGRCTRRTRLARPCSTGRELANWKPNVAASKVSNERSCRSRHRSRRRTTPTTTSTPASWPRSRSTARRGRSSSSTSTACRTRAWSSTRRRPEAARGMLVRGTSRTMLEQIDDLEEAGHRPRLGQLSDPAVQGHPTVTTRPSGARTRSPTSRAQTGLPAPSTAASASR